MPIHKRNNSAIEVQSVSTVSQILLTTSFILDFFPSFLHFMSNFLFLFVVLRSAPSFFWTFFFFLLNISPIFYCFSIIRVDLITKFGHITFTYALYVQSPVSSICMAELLLFCKICYGFLVPRSTIKSATGSFSGCMPVNKIFSRSPAACS